MKKLAFLFVAFLGPMVAQEYTPVDPGCGEDCVCPYDVLPICWPDGPCVFWTPPCWCEEWWGPCDVQDPLPPPPLPPGE